jgi:hypothetical protein
MGVPHTQKSQRDFSMTLGDVSEGQGNLSNGSLPRVYHKKKEKIYGGIEK